jgi:hypothetical protein
MATTPEATSHNTLSISHQNSIQHPGDKAKMLREESKNVKGKLYDTRSLPLESFLPLAPRSIPCAKKFFDFALSRYTTKRKT